MDERIKEILDTVKDISKDTKALAINEGRNHERLKSLEATRKWVSVIFGIVIAAVIVGVLI